MMDTKASCFVRLKGFTRMDDLLLRKGFSSNLNHLLTLKLSSSVIRK
jgi:hypothetical protein